MNSWDLMKKNHSSELQSLESAIKNYANKKVVITDEENKIRIHPREFWEKALYDEGWNLTEQSFYTISGRKLPVRFIGPQKNGVAAQISFSNPDFLSRWLFYSATIILSGRRQLRWPVELVDSGVFL